jgi:mono/diheme cytochrome c family protein
VFVGDFSSMILRVSLEKVGGAWQGAMYPFLGRADLPGAVLGERLSAGNTRMAFGPDGSLYTGQTGGWGGGSDGLQRIEWDGVVAPEMLDVSLTGRGFRIRFTEPMDATTLTAAAFRITRFRFYYHVEYGSPWIDEAALPVEGVRVSEDRRQVELDLGGLVAGFVYEIEVPSLRTAAGAALANPLAYYTANRLLTGEVAVGGTTRLPRPDEFATNVKDMQGGRQTGAALIEAGETVYKLYCLACHQPDGHGLPGGAANFVDDKSRLAKSDEALLEIIARGNEAKGMPAFGAFISLQQRRAALAYIRAKFGSD